MAKKPKKNRPSLLSFLLREFKGRPDPDVDKKENKVTGVCSASLSDTPPESKNAQLLPSLLQNVKTRPDPDEKKKDDVEDMEEECDDEALPVKTGKDLLGGRFEVLPANPLGEDYLKRAGDAVRNLRNAKIKGLEETASQVRRNADNYRQLYLDQRVQEGTMSTENEQELEAVKKKALEAANKEAKEEQIVNNYRTRARELQNQIAWWKQQFGTGQYDDGTININVENLQRELSCIPQIYW